MSLVIDNKLIEQFSAMLGRAQKVLIVSHKNPDGDAAGSLLGLAWLLKRHLGFTRSRMALLLPTALLETFRFLPGHELLVFADQEADRCADAFAWADLIIGVDFNSTPRVGTLQPLLEAATQPKILIDHHHSPERERFDLVFSHPDLSSTCELVYWIARATWGEDCLDRPSAACLYTGMKTDTGSFAFSNEAPSLYLAAAAMVEHDIVPAAIHNEIFNDYSIARMRFTAHCLAHNLHIHADQGLAYIVVRQCDYEQYGVQDPDTEGLVNYTLKMRDISVGVLLKETPTGVRLSFRSKHDFDVNCFAHKHFNGGGHTKAAGGSTTLSMDDTIKLLEDNLLPLL